MAPFTPFFTEKLYQGLRQLHPDVNNDAAAEDAPGKSLSVHYLSIPEVDEAAKNPEVVQRVETLQVCSSGAVSLLSVPMGGLSCVFGPWQRRCREEVVIRVRVRVSWRCPQAVIEAGRNVRQQYNISAKTPVSEVLVVSADEGLLTHARALESYIKEVSYPRCYFFFMFCGRLHVLPVRDLTPSRPYVGCRS